MRLFERVHFHEPGTGAAIGRSREEFAANFLLWSVQYGRLDFFLGIESSRWHETNLQKRR